MRVIGTAGHVDHGKSTLVKALTGIDPDRLKEEKVREMTIDLGFAWLTLPSGEEVGIVDVPGHIDFIKNMLAGVGSIDAALFVVAADEGVMPQTREHLAILDLLGVPRGVIALTKVDLVDADWLELAREDVRDVVQGTVLADAPVVPVSAVTGQGIPDLVAALDALLQTTPSRPDRGRPRLPIDRVFTIAGFGTVVTGTLSDGSLTVGQEVEVVPPGLRARIRGLQSHKRSRQRAVPGSRVAVNLSGVDVHDIHRGDVLTLPDLLHPTTLVDVRLRALPENDAPLRHNQQLDFFVGAAEVPARLRLLGTDQLAPGDTAWAQLALHRPIITVRGDRFIIRQPSPSRTVGGGTVVNPFPRRKYRRFRPEVIQILEVMAGGDPVTILHHIIDRWGPMAAQDALRQAGLGVEEGQGALGALMRSGQVLAPGHEGEVSVQSSAWLFTHQRWQDTLERLHQVLTEYHTQFPLRLAMPREEAKSRLQHPRRPWPARTFNALLAAARDAGWLCEEKVGIRLCSHRVQFTPAQEAALSRLRQAFQNAPYNPPTFAEAVHMVGEDVVLALIAREELVRVNEDVLFSRDAYEEMVARIRAFIQEEGSITVAQARDLFGSSRKYMLALLEHLDARRVTRRVGDARVLRPEVVS